MLNKKRTKTKKSTALNTGGSKNESKKTRKPKSPDWAFTKKDEIDDASNEYEAQKGIIKFRPEFRMQDGETKTIRFMVDEPLCMLFFYNINYKGRWHKFTKPKDDEDILETELERSPVPYFIWEIFDAQGYTKKNGEVVKNICRYWVVPKTLNTRIEKLKERYGPLTDYNIDVQRIGAGTDTQYDFYQDKPSPMPKAALKAKRLDKDWVDYYEPPTVEQQEQIIRYLRKGE